MRSDKNPYLPDDTIAGLSFDLDCNCNTRVEVDFCDPRFLKRLAEGPAAAEAIDGQWVGFYNEEGFPFADLEFKESNGSHCGKAQLILNDERGNPYVHVQVDEHSTTVFFIDRDGKEVSGHLDRTVLQANRSQDS